MSSRSDASRDMTVLGEEMPTIVHRPPDVASRVVADEAIEFANAYEVLGGHPLSPSQEFRLENAMGLRSGPGEKWAASTVVDIGGRQATGKTGLVIARELFGLFVLGEPLQLHTAHEFPTANEAFLATVDVVEQWDDLRRQVDRIRYANGEQGIELKGGRRLKYKARGGGSLRGWAKADLIVYDECQHLKPAHLGAAGPARLANPNPQAWWAGSGGFVFSVLAWEKRKQAILGTGGRLAYTEHTAEQVSVSESGRVEQVFDGDVRDPRVWALANPGLNRWVPAENMLDLLDELGDELFIRECLCVWEPLPDDSGNAGIDPDVWKALAQVSQIESDRTWALAVSPQRDWASIGVAGRRQDGLLHVEWMEHRSGTAWVKDRVVEGWRNKGIPLRVHSNGPEASLIDVLEREGVIVKRVSNTEYAAATGQIIDAVANRELRHLGQRSLEVAIDKATLRTTSMGSQTWQERTPLDDITPLKAVTVALGGVPTVKQPVSAVSQVF